MKTRPIHWRVGSLMILLLSLIAAPAWALEYAANNSLAAPSSQPQFKPGDTLQVAAEGTRLMMGKEVVAQLQKGQPIIVVEVQFPWIGTYVLAGNEKKIGWVRTIDFVPVTSPAKPEPAPRPAVAALVARAVVEHTSSVDRDFLVGKYDRHEVDPNVHVWEPWRH